MTPEHAPALQPTPRIAVGEDLAGIWREACADHAVAWRAWCDGEAGSAPVLAALDREESAARALARFLAAR